jgi:hypothetical protein
MNEFMGVWSCIPEETQRLASVKRIANRGGATEEEWNERREIKSPDGSFEYFIRAKNPKSGVFG